MQQSKEVLQQTMQHYCNSIHKDPNNPGLQKKGYATNNATVMQQRTATLQQSDATVQQVWQPECRLNYWS